MFFVSFEWIKPDEGVKNRNHHPTFCFVTLARNLMAESLSNASHVYRRLLGSHGGCILLSVICFILNLLIFLLLIVLTLYIALFSIFQSSKRKVSPTTDRTVSEWLHF